MVLFIVTNQTKADVFVDKMPPLVVNTPLQSNEYSMIIIHFLIQFGTNEPEAVEILGLVVKTRTKLRIVNRSMLMYSDHGVCNTFLIFSLKGEKNIQ